MGIELNCGPFTVLNNFLVGSKRLPTEQKVGNATSSKILPFSMDVGEKVRSDPGRKSPLLG